MNLKCFFGFHDYEPVGIYWVWDKDCNYCTYLSINVIQENKCTRCGKIKSKIIQAYSMAHFGSGEVLELLNLRHIPHGIDYAIKKRDTLVSESKGGNA